MSDTNLPMIGEVRLFAGNFDPPGWMACDGRLLALSEHQALFEVIGNIYGGDGRNTLAVPDLRGRVPMGQGSGPGLSSRQLGQEGGSQNASLSVDNLPAHGHTLRATTNAATDSDPSAKVLANAATNVYRSISANTTMGADAIGDTGSGSPVPVVQPFTVLRFIMAIAGRMPRDEIRVLRGVSDRFQS
jgi:microcystin-dependent protein